MSSFQPFSFTCRVGACERAFTCFFSGIGSKVHETLRVSFGPRSHLVPNLVRSSFQERFLKELGHLNAWCCYWSGAWCCCWCCCCWVLLLLVLPLVLYWGDCWCDYDRSVYSTYGSMVLDIPRTQMTIGKAWKKPCFEGLTFQK